MRNDTQQQLQHLLATDFTVSKAILGWALIAGGLALAIVMLAAELLDPDSGGFGTVQQIGTALGVCSLLIGLTLLPLGSRPA